MHTKGTTTQGNNIPVAFVEFRDVACAGSAMVSLQGTFLLSSDRGAIRIEFAKSKMAAVDNAQSNNQHHLLREVCVFVFFNFFF